MARCMHYLPTHQHCSPTLLSLVGSACHGATCHIAAEAVKMPPFLDLSLTFFHCPSLHSECVEMNSEYAVCPQNFSTLLCFRRHRFTAFHTAASPTFRRICRSPHQDKCSVGFVLMRTADFSVKSAQAPRPYRQALLKTIWRGSDRVDSKQHVFPHGPQVFVVDGVIRATCHYMYDTAFPLLDLPLPFLDLSTAFP